MMLTAVVAGVFTLMKSIISNREIDNAVNAYTETVNYIESLYTDGTKTDIREEVGMSDISQCINMLSSYKNSSVYESDAYDIISKEVSTISFFVQDRVIYNDLKSGVYAVGSEEYTSAISNIRNDIALYTVSGLSQTMSSRLNILEVEGSILGTNTQNTDLGITQGEVPQSNYDTGVTLNSSQEGYQDSNVGGDIQSQGVPANQNLGVDVASDLNAGLVTAPTTGAVGEVGSGSDMNTVVDPNTNVNQSVIDTQTPRSDNPGSNPVVTGDPNSFPEASQDSSAGDGSLSVEDILNSINNK